MPAILRIFLYQTDASLSIIGSTESYGTIVGQGAVGARHELSANIMPLAP